MTIIEYILDPQDKPRSYFPKTIPPWISDGGSWHNPDGSDKLIGIGVEGSIPEGTKTFTLEELQERQLAIHAEYPMAITDTPASGLPLDVDPDKRNLTDDEVNALVKDWVDARI